MGAVEDTRPAIQDFLAPEIHTLAAKMEARTVEQAQLRSELRSDLTDTAGRFGGDIIASTGRLRSEIGVSEARVAAAIERLRAAVPPSSVNAVFEQMLAEKQRVIDDLQRLAH